MARISWLKRAISCGWIPIGSVMFKISYHKACRKGNINLNIGAGGTHLKGWLNTDITPKCLYMNASRRFPIRDGTVSFIFNEHFINYLSRKAVIAFFKECHRVLRENGVLRVTTIDTEALVRVYLNDPETTRLLNDRNRKLGYQYTTYPIDILNKTFFEDSNVCEYDAPTLKRFFNEAGFQNITNCEVGASSHPALSGIERHQRGTIIDKFVCVIEGTKTTI